VCVCVCVTDEVANNKRSAYVRILCHAFLCVYAENGEYVFFFVVKVPAADATGSPQAFCATL
jgi:hypothetical protein